jgi:hypothetical protein
MFNQMQVATEVGSTNRSEPRNLQILVHDSTVRWFYQAIIGTGILLILVTGASDLGLPFAQKGLILQLDLKREGNVAVWYSSMLLLLGAFSALAISASLPPAIKRRSRYRWVWTLTALFFFGLSVDEVAQFHEMAGRIFTRRVGDVPGLTPGSSPVFAWIVALAPLILGFIAAMLTAAEWLRLHHRSRLLALAGVACWIGVIAAEVVEAKLRQLSMERSIQGMIEEGLEVTGSTLFLIAFVEFLRYMQGGALLRESE